jgi:hypothetical protein
LKQAKLMLDWYKKNSKWVIALHKLTILTILKTKGWFT